MSREEWTRLTLRKRTIRVDYHRDRSERRAHVAQAPARGGHAGKGPDIVQRSNVAELSAAPPRHLPPLPPQPAAVGTIGSRAWARGRRLAMRVALAAALLL